MIIDSVTNWGSYGFPNGRFARAFEWLLKSDLNALPDGRTDIEGDEIFLMMHRRELKEPADAPLEVHDRYADIQVVIRGEETFGWSKRSEMRAPQGPMDEAKDMQLFDDAPQTHFTLREDQMAIFLPTDAHAPMIGRGWIVKCIVKVLL